MSRIPLFPCWLGVALVAGLATTGCGDDDGGACEDPCPVIDEIRCYGSVIQRCWLGPDGCQLWGDQMDCADQGLLCLAPATGPECGKLCTDPCSAGMSRCDLEVWQTCEADEWGCMYWEDFQNCATSSLQCDATTGDASCITP